MNNHENVGMTILEKVIKTNPTQVINEISTCTNMLRKIISSLSASSVIIESCVILKEEQEESLKTNASYQKNLIDLDIHIELIQKILRRMKKNKKELKNFN